MGYIKKQKKAAQSMEKYGQDERYQRHASPFCKNKTCSEQVNVLTTRLCLIAAYFAGIAANNLVSNSQ